MRTALAVVTLLLSLSPIATAQVAKAEEKPWAARPAIRVDVRVFSRAAVGRRMVELYGRPLAAIHVANAQLHAALDAKEITVSPDALAKQRKELEENLAKAGVTAEEHRRRLRLSVVSQEMAVWNYVASSALAAEVGIVPADVRNYLAINQPVRAVDPVESPNDPAFARVGKTGKVIAVETLVRELLPHVTVGERNRLLDRILIEAVVDTAIRSVPPTDPAVLDALLDEERLKIRKASGGKADLETFLARQGRTLDGLRRSYDRRERLRNAVLAQREVSDDLLRAHFSRWQEFFAGKLVRARHIFFRPAPPGGETDWQKALDRALAVRKELMEGADFAEIALRHSDDTNTRLRQGNLGYFPRKSAAMGEPFAAAAFALETGRISHPIQTAQGYHLIEVTGVREGAEVVFEDIRDRVRRDYADSRAVAWVEEQRALLSVKVLWDDLRVTDDGAGGGK